MGHQWNQEGSIVFMKMDEKKRDAKGMLQYNFIVFMDLVGQSYVPRFAAKSNYAKHSTLE